MFGVLGMYNFGSGVEKSDKNSLYNNEMITESNHTANLRSIQSYQ